MPSNSFFKDFAGAALGKISEGIDENTALRKRRDEMAKDRIANLDYTREMAKLKSQLEEEERAKRTKEALAIAEKETGDSIGGQMKNLVTRATPVAQPFDANEAITDTGNAPSELIAAPLEPSIDEIPQADPALANSGQTFTPSTTIQQASQSSGEPLPVISKQVSQSEEYTPAEKEYIKAAAIDGVEGVMKAKQEIAKRRIMAQDKETSKKETTAEKEAAKREAYDTTIAPVVEDEKAAFDELGISAPKSRYATMELYQQKLKATDSYLNSTASNGFSAQKATADAAVDKYRALFQASQSTARTGGLYALPGISYVLRTFDGNLQALESANNALAPSMRIVGSGSSSDIDVRMMKDALASQDKYQELNSYIAAIGYAKAQRSADAMDVIEKYAPKVGEENIKALISEYNKNVPVSNPAIKSTDEALQLVRDNKGDGIFNPNMMDFDKYIELRKESLAQGLTIQEFNELFKKQNK